MFEYYKNLYMNTYGPIVLIEDDEDDVEIFKNIIDDLEIENEILCFANTDRAYKYLKSTDDLIFVIFCAVNLPGTNGLEFKKIIDKDSDLRKKSIPFMFYSTTAHQREVDEAFTEMIVQGFFKKPTDFQEMKTMLSAIFSYWKYCKHPSSQDYTS